MPCITLLPPNCSFDSNHGSYYYNQLAALKLIVNDVAGATNVTNTYFSGIYLGQVEANGEQVSTISIDEERWLKLFHSLSRLLEPDLSIIVAII
jgi:hypothetical protein